MYMDYFRFVRPRPAHPYESNNHVFRTNLIGPEDQVFAKANSDILLAAYRAHNASVKALVPKDKLLVYRIGEGRVPLTFPFDQMNSL